MGEKESERERQKGEVVGERPPRLPAKRPAVSHNKVRQPESTRAMMYLRFVSENVRFVSEECLRIRSAGASGR